VNRYHRAPAQIFSYIFPFLSLSLQFSVIVQNRKKIARKIFIPVLLFVVVPVVATTMQIFAYGLSLTNMSLVGAAVMLYVFVLVDMNNTVERANRLEIEFLREEQAHMQTMFAQTAEALARAIDAKDRYTHGHSARVAEYAKEIATRAGKSQKEIMEVYFAALLHDVGKIGIPDTIINKEGTLTIEEINIVKLHPVIGSDILQTIKQSPYISLGARYHHERYDGHGYPDGLKGEEIPEIARIIAVADTYDAMTSKRSYRTPLPQKIVRSEIIRGSGSQFDPTYAKIMIDMIDADVGYRMHEEGVEQFEFAMA
jgi:HD-GYP domain-containing protein (c-di-GMP phosphodiesterase class II)